MEMIEHRIVERGGKKILAVWLDVTGFDEEEIECLLGDIDFSYDVMRKLHYASGAR